MRCRPAAPCGKQYATERAIGSFLLAILELTKIAAGIDCLSGNLNFCRGQHSALGEKHSSPVF
jgi:hypothetical protein